MLTDHLPRFDLAHLPTPLEEMPRLRALLDDAPRLLIKRDDQTGLATGGNKTRKLEFAVADALSHGADTLITTGGAQSNHCRQTAAAAVRAGLRCVVVLSGPITPRADWNGNLLLDDLLGAEVRWAGERERDAALYEEAEKLREQGAHPYIIPLGASVPVGAVGYVAAAEELVQQLAARQERIDRIIVTSGSGGTHAGLLVGLKALKQNIVVEGMFNSHRDQRPAFVERLKALTRDTAAFLRLDLVFDDDDFHIYDTAGGHEYGLITESERETIRLLAKTEAIIVDSSYTSRALAEMISRIRQGLYRTDETILFWHTGGTAGIFARAGDLMV